MRRMALFFVLLLSACSDKAAPDLQRCEQLESEKKLADAIEACKAAKAKDPESAAGKKADAKISDLTAAKLKAEKEAIDADRKALDEKADAAKKRADGLQDDLKGPADADKKKELEDKLKNAKPCRCTASDPLCDCAK